MCGCVGVCVWWGGGGGRGEGSSNDMCTVNNLSANSSIKGDDININGDLIRYSTKWSSPPWQLTRGHGLDFGPMFQQAFLTDMKHDTVQ